MAEKLPPYSSCVCLAVRRASRLITQAYDAHLAPAGLKVTQFSMLAALALRGRDGAQLSSLADGLDMDASTLTRNLKPLVRDALVELARGDDGRERIARLTRDGRARLRQATPLWKAAQKEALEAFGPRAPKQLADLLAHARQL